MDNNKGKNEKKKRKKNKKFEVGRFKINIAAAVAGIVGLLICAVYIAAFFLSSFKIPALASMIIPLFFTVDLVLIILAFYVSKTNKISFLGHLCGGIAAIAMLIYPSIAAFVALFLFGASAFLLLQKRKYLVYPKRKNKPFYKDVTILLAMLAALVLGGSQTALAIQADDNAATTESTDKTDKSKQKKSSSKKSSESTTESTKETAETTSSSTETTPSSSENNASENSSKAEEQTQPSNNDEEEAQLDYSMQITITDIKEQSELGEGDFKMTTEDTRFVLLYVKVKNTSTESVFFMPDNIFLATNGGDEHFFPFTLELDGALIGGEVEAGKEISGFVAFEVLSTVSQDKLQGQYIGELAADEDGVTFPLKKGEVVTLKASH